MAHVSHKLSNAFEGALAGGGDPATSPLYVFGPFLKLIVVAGVAQITFGASVWLVVLTVAMVSGMYRLVMSWIVDGSGGSGLSEEEFGGWAVKINAGITFVEYTLTFLVSMAALVTFLADRFPVLNEAIAGIQYRTFVAILLSLITGWLVNRGPKVAARAFGPATAGILILLWVMIFATIWQLGFRLPSIDWRAFTSEYLLEYTLGGYVRILAVMTGIEVFANLVAAYEGKREEKSRKAFGSLLIIMGTTSLTMLIVGPAILQLSDPTDPTVSVFTQTMDQLLPAPLPWLGTLVGVAVLLSASAAAAQGVQNLALGLKYRRYVPEFLGRKNRFEVAAAPVWIQVFLIVVCFLAFGTHEETYLAIYAAGVFVLLSMTGWAAAKRLIREMRTHFSPAMLAVLLGTISAAVLTTGATIIIFGERFTEGAWTYLLFIPVLYILFSFFRRRLGDPPQMEERWGRLVVERKYLPVMQPFTQAENQPSLQNLLIPLDGSYLAEEALQLAQPLTAKVAGQVRLLSVDPDRRRAGTVLAHNGHDLETYLSATVQQLGRVGVRAEFDIASGNVAETISTHAANQNMDLIVISTHGRSGVQRFLLGSVAGALMQQSPVPLLITRPGGMKATAAQGPVAFRRLMVTLDGSEAAENILPYITPLASAFDSEIILLSVPDGVDNEDKNQYIKNYLEGMAASFTGEGLRAQPVITGFEPAQTIVEYGITHKVDLIMMATHGRGGMERFMLGSVADRVVRQATCPVFLVPVR